MREALRQLEAEGLISILPTRRATVSSFSLDEVLELMEVRIALDCRALRLAIPNMADIVVVGAGIVGISCAYYLSLRLPAKRIAIDDQNAPMSLTSAASGENYRNWWPHPVMTAFTDYSINLLEEFANKHDNRINMTRRGYALATRQSQPYELLEELHKGYGPEEAQRIRIHGKGSRSAYQPAISEDWRDAPEGVDVIQDPDLIRQHFSTFDPEIETILHIRRAGDISGQQLGSLMLEHRVVR